jgi:hypothetical protein
LEDSAIMSTLHLSIRRRAAMRPRFLMLSALAAPVFGLLFGGLVAGVPTPAAAQFYSPYYDDAPGFYYGPPRGYRRRAPAPQFSVNDVRPMLRSMGFGSINPARATGNAYVTEATDGDGVRLRVRIDRYSGEIISMRPIGSDSAERAPLPPGSVRTPPKKPPAPRSAALPPSAPLPPPAGGGDAGTLSPGDVAPPAATAPGGAPATSTEVKPEEGRPADAKPADAKPADAKPAEAKPAEAKPAEAKPAEAKPAETKPADAKPAAAPTKEAATKPEAPKAEKPIRVIPGVAVPTPEPSAPPVADSMKGTGAGTGTPSGSVSAGTASVLSRDATKKPAEAKPKTSSSN